MVGVVVVVAVAVVMVPPVLLPQPSMQAAAEVQLDFVKELQVAVEIEDAAQDDVYDKQVP